jgi:hypothetical protein
MLVATVLLAAASTSFISIIIFVIIFVIIFLLLRNKRMTQLSKGRNIELSRFKKITFTVLGLVLVGLVVGYTINDINGLKTEFSGNISAPTLEPMPIPVGADKVSEFRVLSQIVLVDDMNEKIVEVHEKIIDHNNRRFEKSFDAKGMNIQCDISIAGVYIWQSREMINAKCTTRYETRFSGSGVKSRAFHHTVGTKFESEMMINSSGNSFFTLNKNSHDTLSVYLVCYRLHPDDNLKQIKADQLLAKLEKPDKTPHANIGHSKNHIPFLVLMEATGICFFVLLIGVILISRGINRNFSFPLVLAAVLFIVIGLKKYEYSAYKELVANTEKDTKQRQIAANRAAGIPFFKVSAEKLKTQFKD